MIFTFALFYNKSFFRDFWLLLLTRPIGGGEKLNLFKSSLFQL
ncbi:hypothetical protein AVDCRST_MAG84-608 [uncultured Microcoleus sp.]|uniref:Uncharacterized protein n=1 Tax=uncultured Microcoleus sp. TaxID=259945 RepID=A0A6J4KLE3_9CYAN|nr:hypothetical protein AVDCRST_MAG84-608 [uncultured Microcoleus sp.]